MDLRPMATAVVNKDMGGGFERGSHYAEKGCTLEFGNIHNIHKVRDAWTAMFPKDGADVPQWWRDVGNSYWYEYIGTIMKVTMRCNRFLCNEGNVAIHCSDGWDRTAQVAALVSLCLDPYHRTLRGFAVLVEKEFVHFGHRFKLRCAQGQRATSEASP